MVGVCRSATASIQACCRRGPFGSFSRHTHPMPPLASLAHSCCRAPPCDGFCLLPSCCTATAAPAPAPIELRPAATLVHPWLLLLLPPLPLSLLPALAQCHLFTLSHDPIPPRAHTYTGTNVTCHTFQRKFSRRYTAMSAASAAQPDTRDADIIAALHPSEVSAAPRCLCPLHKQLC